MIALTSPIEKRSPAITRGRVRGQTQVDGSPVSGALVTLIDRRIPSVIVSRLSDDDGAYSFQVPDQYHGQRHILAVATPPDGSYNAVVADRVMPETVIE